MLKQNRLRKTKGGGATKLLKHSHGYSMRKRTYIPILHLKDGIIVLEMFCRHHSSRKNCKAYINKD